MVSIFYKNLFSTKGPIKLLIIILWQKIALELESKNKFIPVLNYIISTVRILISVAFYTILERKILGYIQIRKGPNKVGIIGILQPFRDAVKLFNKNLISVENTNLLIFIISPLISLILALIIVSIIPFMGYSLFDNKHNIILFFIISSLGVYILLIIGWASNSKYAHIGAIRGVAQIISYEVSFFIITLFIALIANSYNFTQIRETQHYIGIVFGNWILLIFWLIRCLAEVNRRPFDFAEGESELVSGFNVEFMGGWFALIFLAEYSNIIILSILTIVFFFQKIKLIISIISLIIILIFILWIRGSFPRFRYDFLIILRWKIILPLILMILFFPMIFSNWNF